MTRIAYKTLMRNIDEGRMEVWAWGRDARWAEVIVYKANGRSHRVQVEVTNVPDNVRKEV